MNKRIFAGGSKEDRFLSRTEAADGCWNWNGTRDRYGYGWFRFQYKRISAHRYSYERLHGAIPKGLVIDHLCGNKRCVNSSHLEVTTQAENMRRGFEAAGGRELLYRKAFPNRYPKLFVGGLCRIGHAISTEYDIRIYGEKRKHYTCRLCEKNRSKKYRDTMKMRLANQS